MSSFPIALWLALGCRCFAAQELRLAHGASREHAYQIGAEQFATLVEKKTAGKLHVAISPDGRLASEGAAAEAVRLGNADIAILSADMMSYWVPIIQLLSMPYLFRDRLHAYRTVDGEIGEMLNREMEKVGFVNLAYLDIGVRQLANNYRPIRTPQDIINIPIQVMTNNTDASLLE
jgi:TRAP-type C4-dicarboxylate transport system substrate-binding protein